MKIKVIYLLYHDWIQAKTEKEIETYFDCCDRRPWEVFDYREGAERAFEELKAKVKPAKFFWRPKGNSYYEFEEMELIVKIVDEEEKDIDVDLEIEGEIIYSDTILDRYVSPIEEEEEEER